jgi:hypothetical protein
LYPGYFVGFFALVVSSFAKEWIVAIVAVLFAGVCAGLTGLALLLNYQGSAEYMAERQRQRMTSRWAFSVSPMLQRVGAQRVFGGVLMVVMPLICAGIAAGLGNQH